MADEDDKKKAAKGLIKEAFDEWFEEREKARTDEGKKKSGSIFDGLFG